jgi:hypothetical protein
MLSWAVIGYGAALSALAAGLLVGLGGRERRPAVLACAARDMYLHDGADVRRPQGLAARAGSSDVAALAYSRQ